MRHGIPDQTAFHSLCLAWRYQTTSGAMVFQFGPSAVLGINAPTTLVDQFALSDEVYSALAALDPTYALIAGQLREQGENAHWAQLGQRVTASGAPGKVATSSSWSIVSRPLVERLRNRRERDLRIGLTTDGFPPHFKHVLEPQAQFYAVGAPSEVLVVFALPGDKLEGTPLPDGGTGYPVALRVIATNADGQIVRIDTTRRFRADQPLTKGQYLFGLEQLRLAPGTWDVRLLVSEPGLEAGGAIGRIGVVVPASRTLSLSDLVLGREGSGLAWQSPTGTVPLTPLDAFPPTGSAELYYELHGATPDRTYQTDIEVRGVYNDAKGSVHLSFSERATASLVRARRSIGLSQLTPGQYRLTVTVTEQGTGKTAVQRRLLNVSE